MELKHLIEALIFSPLLVLIPLGITAWITYRQKIPIAFQSSLAGFLLCAAVTSYPVYALIAAPLKSWIPPNTTQKADAIVVLGASATPAGIPTYGSTQRAFMGAKIYLEDRRAPFLLLTGFSPTDSLGAAKAMKIIALGMGVPDTALQMISGQTTYHEAALSAPRLQDRGIHKIILVSSWSHIPRATAVWQKQGFEVIPHTFSPKEIIWYRLLSWTNLAQLRSICHEYTGLLVYRLRGWL